MDKKHNSENIEFLDKYIETQKFGTKFWMWVGIIMIGVLVIFLLRKDIFSNRITPKEISNSVTFFDIHSQWIQKEKDKNDKSPGIILVPQSRFKITNIGTRDLEHLSIIGVFTFMDIANVRGEGFNYLKKTVLKPNESTEEIVITSDRGYSASSKEAFKINKNWKRASIKLFARSKGGGIAELETFYISQKIEGTKIDIKLLEKDNKNE